MSLAFEGIDDNEFGGEDVRHIFNRDGFIFLPFDEEDKKTVIDADAFLAQLKETGFVGDDDKLTTGVKPFNVFARVASGVMKQPGMEGENAALGQFAERFVVASNRPENDENWASEDPEWVGKSSMGERHRFLTIKDLSWQYFNVLSFGLVGDVSSLKAAIEVLEAMQAAASAFASATTGWSISAPSST